MSSFYRNSQYETTGGSLFQNACPHCSGDFQKVFHSGKCPKIKAVEYYPNGTIKRIEYIEYN